MGTKADALKPRKCVFCSDLISPTKHFHTTVCAACNFGDCGRPQAHAAVARAVKRGDLAPAKSLACVDCGKPAHGYDHRDYSKPLDVAPVCQSCNWKRGHAKPNAALIAARRVPA